MSIPTIGCKGIQFRSRIEAQWSFIFEQLGYNWEYEPDVNLYMYIPDFIITFPDGNELLVEIKSIVNIWNKDKEYTIHANKIIRSGWTKDFVILGSNYKAINGLTKIGSLHTDSKKYDAFLDLKSPSSFMVQLVNDHYINFCEGLICCSVYSFLCWK